jgi:hypothetical protein
MPWDVTSWMEKNENLQEMIQSTCFAYAWRLKMAWDVKNWDWDSSKTSQIEELTYVLDFHEFKMIIGR